MALPDPGGEPDSPIAMEPREAISQFAALFQGRFEAMASRRIRSLGLNEAIFSGEDAFSTALISMWKAWESDEKLAAYRTLEDVKRSFRRRLRDCIREEWRRQKAKRRGGDLFLMLFSSLGDDSWHPADGPSPAPIERREVQRRARELLALLDRADRSLRTIVRLRRRGLTNAEIASVMHLSVATVKRRIDRIRVIWSNHPDRTR